MLQNPLVQLLPPDQADLVLLMLLSIPASYLLSFIYNKYLFLALTMTLTMGAQSILFPVQKYYLWGQQQLVYILILVVPRRIIGHVIIIQSFTALIILQAYRLYLSYGVNSFDITGIFMMQLFNYIGLGYNYQNGLYKEDLLPSQLSRVVDKPNYLTYLGYVNFLPACLVGPVYQYADFDNYLNRREDYQNIPNTLRAVLKQLGVFIFSVSLYGITTSFPIDWTVSDEFADRSLIYKFFYVTMCITHIELKYVSAWSLGMASMRASGFTYNPKQNIVSKQNGQISEYNFGKVQVNNMTKFYLDSSIKVKVDNWNISVQWALRRYIYENIFNPKNTRDDKERKKLQIKAQHVTGVVSAFWHGLYPGYFVSFVHWMLYNQIAQQVYRLKNIKGSKVSKVFQKYGFVLNHIENLMCHFVFSYFGMSFHLMVWEKGWTLMKSTYFVPYITLYICYYLVLHMKILGRHHKHHHQNGESSNVLSESKNGDENKAKPN